MSTLQTVTIASGSGDTVAQALTKLNANQILLEKCRADTSDPTSPADGEEWVRTDGANNGVKYAQVNSVKTEVLYQYILNQNLNFNDNEALNFLLEQLATGSISAASAGNRGKLEYDTTQEKAVIIGTTARGYAATCDFGAASYLGVDVPLVAGIVDGPATNPTAQVKNEVAGWLFNATNEELALTCTVPNGWTAANDVLLQLTWQLNAGGMSGNADWDCEWISLTPDVAADVLSKTETSATTATTTPTTYTDGTTHTTNITLDFDDVTNPIAIGDFIRANVHLSNITGVTAVHLSKARFLFPCFNYDH